MPSAVTKVLATYELVEMIIAFLPFYDIFRVQTVCKTWQSITNNSSHLRKLTFRMPCSPPVEPFFAITPSIPQTEYQEDFTLNPSNVWDADFGEPDELSRVVLKFVIFNVSANPAPYKSTNLDMFITNPPCTTGEMLVVGYEGKYEGETGHEDMERYRTECSVRDPGGLRFDFLIETSDKVLDSTDNAKVVGWYEVELSFWMYGGQKTRSLVDAQEDGSFSCQGLG